MANLLDFVHQNVSKSNSIKMLFVRERVNAHNIKGFPICFLTAKETNTHTEKIKINKKTERNIPEP